MRRRLLLVLLFLVGVVVGYYLWPEAEAVNGPGTVGGAPFKTPVVAEPR